MSKSNVFKSPEEIAMFEEVNKIDKEKKDYIDGLAEQNAKVSGFSKLLKWNNPKILIVVGGLLNAFNGFI